MLRLLVCGSVDDGKSTLIGRLLLDTGQVPDDQLEALAADSRVHGTTGGDIDPALLTDGLTAEREQGITIDVAWRRLHTGRRPLLVADTPGHVQHTRNMATGASGCRAAVVLVTADRGVLEQTRRHAAIATLMGIHDLVFAINKVDLVGFDRAAVERVAQDCRALARHLGVDDDRVRVVPVVARDGDNVAAPSARLAWWDGPTLLATLDTLPTDEDRRAALPLRLPVQLAVRPDSTFRGYAGTVMTGTLRAGQAVAALPSGVRSTIERIVTFDGDLDVAPPGTPVTVVLADELDLVRGDLIVADDEPDATRPLRSHRLDATLVWLDREPYGAGRRLLLRAHTGASGASVARVVHTLDMGTMTPQPASGITLNDVVRVELAVEREHVFDPYERVRATGAFVLIDRTTQAVVAAGLAHGVPSPFDREPEGDLHARPSRVDADRRRARTGHAPVTVAITGMSGSGKTTLALALEERLFALGASVVRLDGEALRLGLSRGLGFGPDDREEHLRRAAETARLLNDHGQIVLLAAQAPAREVRARMARVIGPERTVQVHLHAPDDVRAARDPSGAHAAVARGDVAHLPGITIGHEPPEDPDLDFDTSVTDLDDSVDRVVALLRDRGVLADPPRRTVPGAPTVWLTGLSGAGKTTIARAVAARLAADGVAHHLLDGDELRRTLSADLGFSLADRAEQVRRVAHLARILGDAGVVPLVALVSPTRADRDAARALHPDGRFLEVHVATPLDVCADRDTKGLYARSRRGDLADLTGVGQDYEPPLHAELTLVADGAAPPEALAEAVLARLRPALERA